MNNLKTYIKLFAIIVPLLLSACNKSSSSSNTTQPARLGQTSYLGNSTL